MVRLRKRLAGGGECIGVFCRVDAPRDAAVVEVPDAVMETEYERVRGDCDACDPSIEWGTADSRGDVTICRTDSLGFGLLCNGSVRWPSSTFTTDPSDAWRGFSCDAERSGHCCLADVLLGTLETFEISFAGSFI